MILIFSLLIPLSSFGGMPIIKTKTISNFEKYKPRRFPTWFKAWPFQRGDARKVYSVQKEEGNKFLHADDSQDLSEQIFKEFIWKIDQYPYFKWKWRAKVLPKGGNETVVGYAIR